MRRRALILALAAAAAPAETVSDDAGAYHVDLPAAWSGRKTAVEGALLSVRVATADASGDLSLTVVEGGYLAPLVHAHADLEREKKNAGAETAAVVAAPVPHAVLDGAGKRTVIAYKRQACRNLRLKLTCDAAAWEALAPGFFEAAARTRCTLARFRRAPDGYARKKKDGFVYLVADGVKPGALKQLQRVVRDVTKDFAKFHGAPARPADEPALVLVHANKAASKSASPDAAKSRHGYWCDPYTRRLFAVPVPAAGSEAHGDLCWKLVEMLFCERYGGPNPRWALLGECQYAWMRAMTGRKPPAVQGAWHDRFPGPSRRLDELAALYAKDRRGVTDHGFAYVLYFRHGPAATKKAYLAFLADLAETGSPGGAEERRLFALDLAELRDLAGRYLATKAKPVR